MRGCTLAQISWILWLEPFFSEMLPQWKLARGPWAPSSTFWPTRGLGAMIWVDMGWRPGLQHVALAESAVYLGCLGRVWEDLESLQGSPWVAVVKREFRMFHACLYCDICLGIFNVLTWTARPSESFHDLCQGKNIFTNWGQHYGILEKSLSQV